MGYKEIEYQDVENWYKHRFFDNETKSFFLTKKGEINSVANEIIVFSEAVLFLESKYPGISTDFYTHLQIGLVKFKEVLETQYGNDHKRFIELEEQVMHDKILDLIEETKTRQKEDKLKAKLIEELQYLAQRN